MTPYSDEYYALIAKKTPGKWVDIRQDMATANLATQINKAQNEHFGIGFKAGSYSRVDPETGKRLYTIRVRYDATAVPKTGFDEEVEIVIEQLVEHPAFLNGIRAALTDILNTYSPEGEE